ncbi:MAG: glycosyltransferase [Candidatus Omnitrophica bacterium]|nr:glycosyltransferase [Candidatus Omnitrophota bacterium]
MAKKKIFIIAPDFYGIDKSISRIFGSFGFEVVLKNTRKRLEPAESIALKAAKSVPLAEPLLTPLIKSYLDRDNEEYISLIRDAKPDLLFVIKGETIYPKTLEAIKNGMKIPCVAYVWDCPFYSFMGQFADKYRKNNFADCMRMYDHIFVHDPYYVREITARGISHVSYLPLATSPGQYKEIDISAEEQRELGYDICFVGSPLYNRVEVLDSLREFRLGVFGDGWDKWHWLRLKKTPDYYKGKAVGEKVLKLYRSSKIVLNIHTPEGREGVNTRTFDIPACGAFELTDYKPEMDRLFKPGKEIAYYKDLVDLKRQVRFYLDNPEKRRLMIEKGKEKVLESHTWHHRIKDALTYLQNKNIIIP